MNLKQIATKMCVTKIQCHCIEDEFYRWSFSLPQVEYMLQKVRNEAIEGCAMSFKLGDKIEIDLGKLRNRIRYLKTKESGEK